MKKRNDKLEFEVFLVSAFYWGCIFLVFLWLSRQLAALRKKLASVEKGGN